MKLNMIKRFISMALTGAFLCLTGCKEDVTALYGEKPSTPTEYTWAKTADTLQKKLQDDYWNGTHYRANANDNSSLNYWWQAHALDVLADGYERTGNDEYTAKMRTLLSGIKAKNPDKKGSYENNFYDDMGWLALASLRAYELTKGEEYLNAITVLWKEIQKGITDSQGGGVSWSKGKPEFKNTPATAPAIILACRLYRIHKSETDKDIALKLYKWLKKTLVDTNTGVVWDGINADGKGALEKAIYTYNQGVFIGAAHEMYKLTKDVSYLEDATKTALNVLTDDKVARGGILKNENQGDGGLFKGILVRYMTLFIKDENVKQETREKLAKFLLFNAQTAFTQAISRPDMYINSDWSTKPGGAIDLSTQLSGMMLIEAAARLDKK